MKPTYVFLGLFLLAAPVTAQPFVIPLEPQRPATPPPPPSPVPVAPPQAAAPSTPSAAPDAVPATNDRTASDGVTQAPTR